MTYWIGRKLDGKWLLDDRPLVIARRGETDKFDLYPQPGGETAFQGICATWLSRHCPAALKMKRLDVWELDIPENNWRITEVNDGGHDLDEVCRACDARA